MTERTRREGCSRSCRTVCRATARSASAPVGWPVLVAGPEEVAGGPEVDQVPPRLAGPQAGRPDDAVGQVDGAAVGVDVAEPGHEVGAGRAGGGPELDPNRAGHLQVALKRLGRVGQHVRPGLDRALVPGTGPELRRHQERPPERRHRPRRVVVEALRLLVRGNIGRQQQAFSEVERPFPRLRRRPALLVTPAVRAHDEDADRRLFHHPVLHAVKPVVEPPELERAEVHLQVDERGLGSEPEVELADRVELDDVGPGPDQEL